MITVAESRPDIRIPTDTPYFALTGELWGVSGEDFGEHLPRYNGTTLYDMTMTIFSLEKWHLYIEKVPTFLTHKDTPYPDKLCDMICAYFGEQGKSEGFESCDRPIVRKRPIWVKICDVLSRVTLKFDGWPWKTIGHLFFAVSSFVQHFIAIGEFKLELQSGNAQFGSNSTIFRAMWPWNLTDDLEKQ